MNACNEVCGNTTSGADAKHAKTPPTHPVQEHLDPFPLQALKASLLELLVEDGQDRGAGLDDLE